MVIIINQFCNIEINRDSRYLRAIVLKLKVQLALRSRHRSNGRQSRTSKMQLSVVICALICIGYRVNGEEFKYLKLPEAQHNISSVLCIIKFCEKYFRSEKAVIGSLVIFNVQNTTEFHTQLIIMLNEHANYDLGVMTKDASKPHGNPLHVVDKAKNYFVVFNRTGEVADAINQW